MRDTAGQERLSLKTASCGVVGALLGVVIGRLVARQVLDLFGGEPGWIVPVVIIGSVAVCVVAFLLLPLRRRKQTP